MNYEQLRVCRECFTECLRQALAYEEKNTRKVTGKGKIKRDGFRLFYEGFEQGEVLCFKANGPISADGKPHDECPFASKENTASVAEVVGQVGITGTWGNGRFIDIEDKE